MIRWWLSWLRAPAPAHVFVLKRGLCIYCGAYASAPGSIYCDFMGCDRYMHSQETADQ